MTIDYAAIRRQQKSESRKWTDEEADSIGHDSTDNAFSIEKVDGTTVQGFGYSMEEFVQRRILSEKVVDSIVFNDYVFQPHFLTSEKFVNCRFRNTMFLPYNFTRSILLGCDFTNAQFTPGSTGWIEYGYCDFRGSNIRIQDIFAKMSGPCNFDNETIEDYAKFLTEQNAENVNDIVNHFLRMKEVFEHV